MAISKYIETRQDYLYSPTTKIAANQLSKYQLGRNYKYSVYQQLLNGFSSQIDQLGYVLYRHSKNRFPSTFLLDTIDVCYTVAKPTNVNSVEYYDGSTWIPVSASSHNDYESWWYNSLPTGINIIENVTLDQEYLLQNSPLNKTIILDKLFIEPCTICLKLDADSDTVFINNSIGEDIAGTHIIISGIDIYGIQQKEDLIFYLPGFVRSSIPWRKIDKLETEAFDLPAKFSLTITTGTVAKTQMQGDDSYSLQNNDGITKSIFWQWDIDNKRLLQKEYTSKDILDYYSGVKDIEISTHSDLMVFDDTENDFIKLTDIDSFLPAADKNLLYVLTDNYLIAYNKWQTYSPLAKLTTELRTPDPLVNLDVMIDAGKITITGEYNRIQTNKFISKYRFIIMKTDGSILYCHEPSVANNNHGDSETKNNDWRNFSDNNYWTDYTLKNTYGFYTPIIEYALENELFDQDFIVRLDLLINGESIETDTFIVDSQRKYPLFQLPLSEDCSAGQMYFDHDGLLCINVGLNKIKTIFRNDTYITDSNTGLIIFAEKYNAIRINGGSSVVPNAFNALNELDQIGAIHSLPRFTGEKNHDYIKRLKYCFGNRFDSTRNGLINAITVESGLKVEDVFHIKRDSQYEIRISTSRLTLKFDDIESTIGLFELATLNHVKTWFEENGFTVTLIADNSILNYPARSLLDSTNKRTIKYLAVDGVQKVQLKINYNEYLLVSSIDITDFEYVNRQDLFESGKNQFTVYDNTIITNIPLSYENKISYSVCKRDIILRMSPVILSSLNDVETEGFPTGGVSSYAQIILEEIENQFPSKWNK